MPFTSRQLCLVTCVAKSSMSSWPVKAQTDQLKWENTLRSMYNASGLSLCKADLCVKRNGQAEKLLWSPIIWFLQSHHQVHSYRMVAVNRWGATVASSCRRAALCGNRTQLSSGWWLPDRQPVAAGALLWENMLLPGQAKELRVLQITDSTSS